MLPEGKVSVCSAYPRILARVIFRSETRDSFFCEKKGGNKEERAVAEGLATCHSYEKRVSDR